MAGFESDFFVSVKMCLKFGGVNSGIHLI